MEVIVTIVSKLVYFTYFWDVSNLLLLYREIIIHLLSTMDIPVGILGLSNLLLQGDYNQFTWSSQAVREILSTFTACFRDLSFRKLAYWDLAVST